MDVSFRVKENRVSWEQGVRIGRIGSSSLIYDGAFHCKISNHELCRPLVSIQVAALEKQGIAHSTALEASAAERRRLEARALRAESSCEEAAAETQRVREACERRVAESEEEAKRREERAMSAAESLQRRLDEGGVAHAEEVAQVREASAELQRRANERVGELERVNAAARSETEAMRLEVIRLKADLAAAEASLKHSEDAKLRAEDAAAAEARMVQVRTD